MDILKKAKNFAAEAHYNQKRKFTGEDYIKHPKNVAQLLWEVTDGQASNNMYIAALLHDTVEDTEVTMEEIGRHFGGEVMEWVNELTIKEPLVTGLGKGNYLAWKMNHMSEEALTIKLCDRLDNVLSLDNYVIPDAFVKSYVKETQYILAKLTRKMSTPCQTLLFRIAEALSLLTTKRDLF